MSQEGIETKQEKWGKEELKSILPSDIFQILETLPYEEQNKMPVFASSFQAKRYETVVGHFFTNEEWEDIVQELGPEIAMDPTYTEPQLLALYQARKDWRNQRTSLATKRRQEIEDRPSIVESAAMEL